MQDISTWVTLIVSRMLINSTDDIWEICMIKLAICSLNIELSFETNFFELNIEINDVSLNLESA